MTAAEKIQRKHPAVRRLIESMVKSAEACPEHQHEDCPKLVLAWWEDLYASRPFQSWDEPDTARFVGEMITKIAKKQIERDLAYDRTFSRN